MVMAETIYTIVSIDQINSSSAHSLPPNPSPRADSPKVTIHNSNINIGSQALFCHAPVQCLMADSGNTALPTLTATTSTEISTLHARALEFAAGAEANTVHGMALGKAPPRYLTPLRLAISPNIPCSPDFRNLNHTMARPRLIEV